MMHVQEKALNQQATTWRASPNGYGGDAFSVPLLVLCRWQNRQEIFRSNIDQREIVSQAVVYVDTDLDVGDYLCLGDQTLVADPSVLKGAFKIQRFDVVTDLRSVSSVRMAVL